MRVRFVLFVLTGVALVTIAGGLWVWLGSWPAEESRPFASVRGPGATEAPAPASQRIESALRTAHLPRPAPAGGQAGPIWRAPDAPQRLRDPVTLARALLLHPSRAKAGGPTSRVRRVQALGRDLALLARELRAAAAEPTVEALSELRSRFDQTQSAAAELFPEPAPASPARPAARPSLPPERRLERPPPRLAPPGVLDRVVEASPPADPPAVQLRALLGAVDAALAGPSSDPARLERVAREIDAALASDRSGRGPALQFSAARFGSRTP